MGVSIDRAASQTRSIIARSTSPFAHHCFVKGSTSQIPHRRDTSQNFYRRSTSQILHRLHLPHRMSTSRFFPDRSTSRRPRRAMHFTKTSPTEALHRYFTNQTPFTYRIDPCPSQTLYQRSTSTRPCRRKLFPETSLNNHIPKSSSSQNFTNTSPIETLHKNLTHRHTPRTSR